LETIIDTGNGVSDLMGRLFMLEQKVQVLGKAIHKWYNKTQG
jgi:hypothetical protein